MVMKTKYQNIASIIEDKISKKIYPPGSKLPGLLALAKEYDVSVITSNRALKELELIGLVERRERSGTFVLNQKKKLRSIYAIADSRLSDENLQIMDYWRGAVSRALALDISIQMIQLQDPNFSELVIPERCVGRGLIFMGRSASYPAYAAQLSKIPHLYAGFELEDNASYVLEDRRKAVRELVKVLIEDGFKRIGFIGHLASINHSLARDGYMEGIEPLKLGYRYIRDANNKNIAAVTRDLLTEDLGIDAVVVMGAELPIAALPVILACSRKPAMGVLTENSHILQLSNTAYIASYSQIETGRVAVELLNDIALNKVKTPVTLYTPFTILRPAEP